MSTLYVVMWHNESGDRGVSGYCTERPTEAQLEAYFRKHHPGDFEDGERYVYWSVEKVKPFPAA